MSSINQQIPDWSTGISVGASVRKDDIVKYLGNFYYATKDFIKIAGNETDPIRNSIVNTEFWDGIVILSNGEKIPKFFWPASYTSTISHKPLVTVIRFGNGYEQRINKNINSDLKTLQLRFEQKTEKEACAIVHFLKEASASKSFAFSPPGIYQESSYRTRYVCREWETAFNFKENYSISAKFDEVSA